MLEKTFTFSLMILLVESQQYSITACLCQDLLSEGDCIQNIIPNCSWDLQKKLCTIFTASTNLTMIYPQYCDSHSEMICPYVLGCAWLDKKCDFFTGCTAYPKGNNYECQAISNRCITDGTHCVEIDACSTYKKQLPCVKNTAGSLCYWDTIKNTCVDANSCDKLPATFTTDRECRDVISTCTTKTGGGCVDSGIQCSDQKVEIQCVWNKLRTIACYWDGIACNDKTCDNAPTSLTTEYDCRIFTNDGSCTTKADGGCVTRTSCSNSKIEESCITNSSGDDCYWTGTACVDKTCVNAPVTMTTNSACAGFVTGCITKSGGGCIANGDCSAANVQTACVKNSSNFDCIWDTTCKEKTCNNAPIANMSHDMCTSYLSTCTVKSGGGCQNRSCTNAPTTIKNNDECEEYLKGSNCIAKTGGGCVINTTCAAITLDAACVKNSNGQTCFWDKKSSTCKDKICVNAPSTNTTHDQCQAFLNTCTVNQSDSGCVEKKCENSLAQDICDKDTNNRACIWKGKCYKKQCVLAPSATTTHADCQTYHSSCTLSNSGFGCVTLPLKCEAITIQAACNMKSNKKPCGWNGSQCIDKACSTALKSLKTTSECALYLITCVANNPVTVNGSLTIQGCQDLPTTCAARKSTENCEIRRFGFPTCLWVSSSQSCVQKSCATASTVGTTGALSVGVFTFSGCLAYLNTCISNNSADGCMAKPSSCSSLVVSNCQIGSKASGDCYWNGISCVDRICANIIQTTHSNCINAFVSCTVNNEGTACQPLATVCTSYQTQENCRITSTNKNCVWTGLACRNATCADAPDTASYDSDSKCSAYQSPNETCTVIYKVGGQGCVKKSAHCSDYMTSAQCHKTITNLTASDDCKWIIDKCYALSSLANRSCTTFIGTQAMCQGYRVGCTNFVGAGSSASCTLDCTLITGSDLTFADCQELDSTCSVKKDGTGCIKIQLTCTEYGSIAINCFRSSANGNAGYCTMNNSYICQAVTAASECSFVSGLIDMNHAQCQLYHSSCTSLKDGTGCQEYKAFCSDYEVANNCSISGQGRCFFDGINCFRFSNCAAIIGIGLTNTICQSYDTGCVVNYNRTACQEKLATCDLYLTQNSCTTSITVFTCVWSGTTCISVTIVATECAYVTGIGLTDAICATYNAGCTSNRAGTTCQEKRALCADYIFEATCSFSSAASTAANCAWSGTACISVIYAASECAYVTGIGLTDTICATYNAGCTSNRAGTTCQEKRAICADYIVNQAKCSFSSAASTAANCAWSGTDCISVTNVATECAYVTGTGLSDAICASYNVGCGVNRYRTACQEKKPVCPAYTTESTCSTAIAINPGNQCVWRGTDCISVTTVATECAYVTGTGLSDAICSSYNAGCGVNRSRTACQEKLYDCSYYADNQGSCSVSIVGLCVWNGMNCISVTNVATDCAYVTGTGLSDVICATYNVGCINLKDGTGCQEGKPNCKGYTTQNQCSTQINNFLSCLWIDNSCYTITDLNCRAITGSNLDHDHCQTYSTGCTSVSDGTKCQDFKSNCEQYPGTILDCTRTPSSKCYLQGATCITISNATTDCAKITGLVGTITYEICQSYHTGCSVNRKKSACVQQQSQCSVYTALESCYRSLTGLCISSTYQDNSCVAAQTANTCDSVYLGTGNYRSANCNEMKVGCTNNGTTACVAKSCANAAGIAFTHTNCNSWFNTCTVNFESTACQTMASKCADQTQASCLYSFEGECAVIGKSCVRKTCDTASNEITHDDDSECSSYLQSCTVARLGGCQGRTACTTYKSSIQCKLNSSGGKCFWNPTQQICVDLNCNNIEQSTKYDTHNECVAVDAALACTVRAKDGVAVQGCMARGACRLYTIEEQCKTNASGGVCVWNINENLPAPVCQDKSCTISGSNPTLGECQQAFVCQSYINKEQCQTNGNGDPCEWNGTQCIDKSCSTAATTDFDDDIKCRTYMNNKCTVSDSGQGCVEIPATCETMTQKQCYYNKAGDSCYWAGTTCITRSCENAPDLIVTADECNTYLAGCTLDNIKCKTKICEDFALTTDDQCKQVNYRCTTNGKNCVSRGSCLQALDKAGCVTSQTGEQCEWIPEIDLNPAYCTIKTCSTAPNSLKTEKQCQEYFPNCTTKKGGGCVIKTSCQAATVEGACTTAYNGKVCAWDIITQLCRIQDCQDIDGTLHAACRSRRNDCTAGVNGKCAKVQNCEQTKVRAACIEGLNGPCLWIDKYINQDGSKGACFQYTSCQSLNWISDKQCKQISDNCTTDGNKCVAITLCSETNTNGGCVTGYDGPCIQSVPALYSLDPEVCQLYTSCENAFYLTHKQCQQANNNCTTNGTTGCIKLGECSSYLSQDGCVINKAGLQIKYDDVIKSNVVISTGLCTWNAKHQNCRDQSCSDYQNSTHQECSAIVSTCTSDGETCINKDLCSKYITKNVCETAVGSDGICIWEVQSIINNYNSLCRLFACQDVQKTMLNNECLTSSLSCVLDGNICIPKANCSTYKYKTGCNSGGLDGICVFIQNNDVNVTRGIGTCSLMISCESANNDSNACQAAKDRCFWKFTSTTSTQGQCSPLDCETNYQQNGHCSRFLKWDKKSQEVCIRQGINCIAINPIILPQSNCLKISGFTYTWNASNNKCQVCKGLDSNPGKKNETTQQYDNETSTSSKLILSKIGIIMIYYLLS